MDDPYLHLVFFSRATHSDEMCNFYIMYFYDAEKFGNIDQLPCGGVDTTKLKYPKDSDVTLAEVEKKNSLLIHSKFNDQVQCNCIT